MVLGHVHQLAHEWLRGASRVDARWIHQRAYETVRCHWAVPSVLQGRFRPGVVAEAVNAQCRQRMMVGSRDRGDGIVGWRATPQGVTYDLGEPFGMVSERVGGAPVSSVDPDTFGRSAQKALAEVGKYPLIIDLGGWAQEMDHSPPPDVRRVLDKKPVT